MPKRRQRSSHGPVSGSGGRRNAAKTSSSSRGYTQKEYLPGEKRRLLELVDRYGDDWKTIVRQYNAGFDSQGRKRTEEGLKNKHGRLKKEEEEEERIRILTGANNLTMYGWSGASTVSSQGLQPALGDQMPPFESAPSSGSDIVDLAAYLPTPYVEQVLDSVYAGYSSSDFSSSPLNLPSTPYTFTDAAGSGYGLESLDSVCCGWSAVDFRSSLTELMPSSIDPVWPSTLATAPTPGGGLDSLFVGRSADDFTSFSSDLSLAPGAFASTAGLGDGQPTCGLTTYGSVPAPDFGEEDWFCDVSCRFQAF
ncbi:hypothetical protein NX059_012172 [Plenodomus lindquistii]|nr:hypothetical protein NX059_012172 [Plenodomus lindquistii]